MCILFQSAAISAFTNLSKDFKRDDMVVKTPVYEKVTLFYIF